jgi:hypothetical protein
MSDLNGVFGGLPLERAENDAEVGGVLAIPEKVHPTLLPFYDEMFRRAVRDYPGSGEVIFTDGHTDEENPVETWDESSAPFGQETVVGISEAKRWQNLMGIDHEPTPAEVRRWRTEQDANVHGKDYPRDEKLLVEFDAQTQEEKWKVREELIPQPERWRRLMGWPVEPSLADALAWQRYQDARANAALWHSLNPAPAGQP